jgi:hypothetical protein
MNIVYEDALSSAVIERLLTFSKTPVTILRKLGGKGCGYIRSRIETFQKAAHHQPFFVLIDSDKEKCAYRLLNSLLPGQQRHHNFILRIAVREVEAWLLADSKGTSRFLGISERLVNTNPESLVDAKSYLIDLARRSRIRKLVEGLVPDSRTSAVVGPEYNQILSFFVKQNWDIRAAASRSESLRRALAAVENLYI